MHGPSPLSPMDPLLKPRCFAVGYLDPKIHSEFPLAGPGINCDKIGKEKIVGFHKAYRTVIEEYRRHTVFPRMSGAPY